VSDVMIVIGCVVAYFVMGGVMGSLGNRWYPKTEPLPHMAAIFWPAIGAIFIGWRLADWWCSRPVKAPAMVPQSVHDKTAAELDRLRAELQALKTAKAERGGLR
jgi:hypothetical protein